MGKTTKATLWILGVFVLLSIMAVYSNNGGRNGPKPTAVSANVWAPGEVKREKTEKTVVECERWDKACQFLKQCWSWTIVSDEMKNRVCGSMEVAHGQRLDPYRDAEYAAIDVQRQREKAFASDEERFLVAYEAAARSLVENFEKRAADHKRVFMKIAAERDKLTSGSPETSPSVDPSTTPKSAPATKSPTPQCEACDGD